jgi:alpha-mannosidase
MRMDIPFAVVRPEVDQLPGACKNWFTVQRWIDISNDQYGVTWATVDAPLVEVGAITAEQPWMRSIEPSQTLYSYVMNNYWHTNYKADQEGPTVFRYAIRPHAGGYDPVAAARFGVEVSQPLVAVPAAADAPAEIKSRFTVEPAEVLVTAFKPSRDRNAWIVRLLNVGPKEAKATLRWADPAPKTISLSNLAEEAVTPASGPIDVPAMGLVTLRAEIP